MLLHHPHGSFTDFRGKLVCLVHGFIFSGVEASAKPGAVHHALVIHAMPYLEFRINLKDPDQIKVALPSDKKGKRPTISCSKEEVPILADAIAVAPF
jgi:hypothetical protein